MLPRLRRDHVGDWPVPVEDGDLLSPSRGDHRGRISLETADADAGLGKNRLDDVRFEGCVHDQIIG
jgi:hypothetical protein